MGKKEEERVEGGKRKKKKAERRKQEKWQNQNGNFCWGKLGLGSSFLPRVLSWAMRWERGKKRKNATTGKMTLDGFLPI